MVTSVHIVYYNTWILIIYWKNLHCSFPWIPTWTCAFHFSCLIESFDVSKCLDKLLNCIGLGTSKSSPLNTFFLMHKSIFAIRLNVIFPFSKSVCFLTWNDLDERPFFCISKEWNNYFFHLLFALARVCRIIIGF